MGRVGRCVAVIAIVALAGCIRANTVACGELSCPETLQCVADRCVTDEQVESCRTMAEGTECNADGVINGHCIDGACVDSICGNGFLELGEACDDGNVDGEDGCSARCDSDETCGNGTVDLFREQCDEGLAALSGDGCSSRCAVEYPTWRRETPRELSARSDHMMVAIERPDQSDSAILLFGGNTATAGATNETWLWKTNQWRQLRPRTSPPGLKSQVLAYDTNRDRVVLFMGADLSFAVWEWDGVDWSERTQIGEGPKIAIAAAYHEATQRIIVWNGTGSFEWTASGWRKLGGRQPTPRTATVIAYVKRGDAPDELVMFGGAGATVLNDTWLFDGVNWTEALGSTKPPARHAAMMAWDPVGKRVVLFGGFDGATLDDTWLYNGAWGPGGASSFGRSNAAMAYDSRNARVMIYGGLGQGGTPLNDQAAYSPSDAWAPVTNPPRPSATCNGTLTYLPATGETVFTALDKSWRWDGIQWIINPAAPVQRCTPAAASSPTGNEVVVFGGNATTNASTYWLDTWIWNGSTGTALLAGGPVARRAHAMALDERAGRTVLFGGLGVPGSGGSDSVATVYADTWEWDGSTWSLRPTVDAPTRQGHALAFDRISQTLVMFGGSDKDGLLATTFELDGMTWRSLATAHTPLATPPVVMATGSRGRPVLLDAARQTWELQRENNVADWVQLPTIGTPPALAVSKLAYDPMQDQLLLVGVASSEVQVWSLTFVSPQLRESCVATEDLDGDDATGCADPDCWGTCDPQCSPVAATTCKPLRPRCGDGMCSTLEDYQVCPADCPLPP